MNWLPLVIVAAVLFGLFALKRASFVSAEIADQLLRQGALVVDVRNPSEFNSPHLPGALSLPLGELEAGIARHAPNKDQVLLVHCLSGGRSAVARQQLKRMGYHQVFNLGSYNRAERIVRGTERG